MPRLREKKQPNQFQARKKCLSYFGRENYTPAQKKILNFTFPRKIMKNNPSDMQYPLQERIGTPELLVGREEEFAHYRKWISGIPKKLSPVVILISKGII